MLLSVLSATATARAETFADAASLKRLKAGEILVGLESITGSDAVHAEAAIEIALPPAQLWAAMVDCTRALKYLARLKSCAITAADPHGRWDVREHVIEWFWPLSTVRSVFRSEYAPFETIRFRRLEGNLKDLAGTWRLQAIREGRATRLHYDVRIDPGVAMPGFLLRSAIEGELRKSLAGLRKEATGRD